MSQCWPYDVWMIHAFGGGRKRANIHAFNAALAVTTVAAFSCLVVAQGAPAWRYDLRTGDHLIYRYSLHRQVESKDEQYEVDVRFRSHVLVTGATARGASVGFQRNREAADLIRDVSKGKDKLAREVPDFQKRMRSRPSRFSEANDVSATGEPGYDWELARETSGRIVEALHEVITLPPAPKAQGETWRSGGMLDFELRWVGDESIHGRPCHHVEGTLAKGAVKLSYWWSPESGVIEQIVLDGSYLDFDSTVHETARMELESKTRGESVESWLNSPDTRQAVLQSILLSPEVPMSAPQLGSIFPLLLSSNDEPAQAMSLAIASRWGLELPHDDLQGLAPSSGTLMQAEMRILAEPNSIGASRPTVDECGRPPGRKPPAGKFGTLLESAPATPDTPGSAYLLRVPLSYREDRASPLLIYLSGGDGLAINGMNSAQDVVSATDYLVLYPQAAGLWWKAEVARRFDAVLNDVLRRYNVDRDRIYITGFSNGGSGALYYATLWPQRFAAVVSLMGSGQCIDGIKAGLGNARNLPMLFVHGADDPIISPDCSTSTQAALEELHPAIKPELKILPKHGHDITLASDDGLALAFFKDKLRNPFTRTVDLSESDALASRAYWIEILNGMPGKSDVDARVKANNTIEIHSHDVKKIRLHQRPELLPNPGELRIVWNGKRVFSGQLSPLPPGSTSADPKLDNADTRDLTLP